MKERQSRSREQQAALGKGGEGGKRGAASDQNETSLLSQESGRGSLLM
jgi:hypothetical protein